MSISTIIGSHILDKCANEYRETGDICLKDLVALHYTFQQKILLAFELVDLGSVTVFKSSTSSGKAMIRVISSQGDYWIVPGSHECQCIAFQRNKDVCKHILAAEFTMKAMNVEDYVLVTDDYLSKIFLDKIFQ